MKRSDDGVIVMSFLVLGSIKGSGQKAWLFTSDGLLEKSDAKDSGRYRGPYLHFCERQSATLNFQEVRWQPHWERSFCGKLMASCRPEKQRKLCLVDGHHRMPPQGFKSREAGIKKQMVTEGRQV